jgi:predicted Zn-dependent protease with MMP-like domain
MGQGIAWDAARAPSLADIERLGEDAIAGLPTGFRELWAGLIVQVDDFPDAETLDELACESEFDLLGLFRGRGLAQGGPAAASGALPNMVWLYRRPILDYWSEHEETLGAVVRHVLVHEIGHHFGLSDADMAAIEAQAAD